MRTGVQFLAHCLRSDQAFKPADVQLLAESNPSSGDRWALAEEHGVDLLLFTRLREAGGNLLGVSSSLNIRIRENLLNNLQLVACFHEMIRGADARGLRLFCFKGPVLAAAEYGSLSVRAAGDIDLLVAPEDVDQACEVLKEAGFRPVETLRGRHYREFHFHLPFESSSGVEVELHWSISREYLRVAFDFSELWARRQYFDLQDGRVPILSPEDHFLILCVHGTRHVWERLIWICDLRAVVENHPGFDWDRVRAEASRKGCFRMMLLGVYLMHHVLNAKPPRSLISAVYRDPAVIAAAGAVIDGLSSRENVELGALERDRFCFQLRERWRDRFRFFWALPWREYLDMWEDGLDSDCRGTGWTFSRVLKGLALGLRRAWRTGAGLPANDSK